MTNEERKVFELALEALQDYVDEHGPWSDDSGAQYVLRVGKEALAQPEQEPVAWINWCAATGNRSVSFVCESELASQPLYTKEKL